MAAQKILIGIVLVAMISTCIKGENQTIACSGSYNPIRCVNGHIRILSAVYGRTTMDECPHEMSTTDCEPQDVTRYIRSDCDNQDYCAVKTNYDRFSVDTKDPCPGFSKYVDVKYTCVPRETHQTFGCSGTKPQLRCAKGLIRIQSAVYGRTEMDVCPHHRSTTDCEPQDVSQHIRWDCDAHTSCTVETRYNERFIMDTTDPCPGYSKYVDVKWTCDTPHTYTVATRTYGPVWLYEINDHGSEWAESNANVKIRFHGAKGSSGFHMNLNTPADDLQAFTVDVFNNIRVFDVGDLTKIDVMVWEDDDNWGPMWIAVRDDERQKAWLFRTPSREESRFEYHRQRSLVNPTPISQGDFSKYFTPRELGHDFPL